MTYNYINNHRRGGKSFSDGRDELRNLQVYKQCAKWETTCRGWKIRIKFIFETERKLRLLKIQQSSSFSWHLEPYNM